jgi:hypothetical protein
MSLITTAAAATASPVANLFTHGHKKGGHTGGKEATAGSPTQGPATTQSLLSSVFESIEQVIGISLTAPKSAASATAPAAAATAAAGASVAIMPNAGTSFSGIGAHINTKA